MAGDVPPGVTVVFEGMFYYVAVCVCSVHCCIITTFAINGGNVRRSINVSHMNRAINSQVKDNFNFHTVSCTKLLLSCHILPHLFTVYLCIKVKPTRSNYVEKNIVRNIVKLT